MTARFQCLWHSKVSFLCNFPCRFWSPGPFIWLGICCATLEEEREFYKLPYADCRSAGQKPRVWLPAGRCEGGVPSSWTTDNMNYVACVKSPGSLVCQDVSKLLFLAMTCFLCVVRFEPSVQTFVHLTNRHYGTVSVAG